ncbi:4Fe-4S binding protein [Raoultibacter massiliensis]|uniref:4Fe-4S binding protein n=1 Tax=Raoultibacter massiliensis TaxID=1852371 RepID=A0ABV1J9P2_9ACTN|nr:4Fe-4S binding protein [Raoultibacter massiliensis]
MKLIARFKRHIIQLLAALLYNLNFEGFATGTIYQGSSKGICVPGLNCYSCPGAIGACPIGSLQAALVASDQKLPLYVIGTILAFGALLGRTVCGWLCPFGLIQDLLDKAPLPKVRKGAWSRAFSWGKYVILIGLVIIAPLVLLGATGVGTPAFCAYLCPAGTIEAGIPLVTMNEGLRFMLGSLFNWKVGVLVALVLVSLFVYRPFCRFLCPLGALYSFFNRFALLRYRVDNEACTNCGACLAVCKVDIRTVSDRECIQCGACVTSCKTNAIRFSLRDMLANNLHLDGSRRDDAPPEA